MRREHRSTSGTRAQYCSTLWAPILVATVGVLIGTIVGERILLGLSPRRFGQTIGGAIGALGIWMLVMPV